MPLSKHNEIKLHVKSYGRCNLCEIDLYGYPTYVGENAHITPRRVGGPRGGTVPEFDTETYENHILLCPTHHTTIDKAPDLYPDELLLRIKYEFETRITQMISFAPHRQATATYLRMLFRYSTVVNFDFYVRCWPQRLHMDLVDLSYFAELSHQDIGYFLPLHDSNIGLLLDHFYETCGRLDRLLMGQVQTDATICPNFVQVGYGDYIEINSEMPQNLMQKLLDSVSNLVFISRNLVRDIMEYCRLHYPEVLN